MEKRIFLSVPALLISLSVFCQKTSIDLTFKAIHNAAYVRLDSVKVMNRTQGGDTVIHYPDTTLTIQITPGDTMLYAGYSPDYPVGVQESANQKSQFQLFPVYPNPVKYQGIVSMCLPEKGSVQVMVTDISGRVMINSGRDLEKGEHTFRFTPGDGHLYFLTARWNGTGQSIKILTAEPGDGRKCALEYTGSCNWNAGWKKSSPADGSSRESGIIDTPEADTFYTFQFASNIPCPGTPTVTYQGQVYHTVQILSQCWMKENLNVGTMINSSQDQADNDTIEKYCYSNNPDSCTKYGGLYLWDEVMQYTTEQGAQGICPPGWHIPADEEWKVLEGVADSHFAIGDPVWEYFSHYWGRGYDAGTNLITASGWKVIGGGTDLYGFSGLPSGGTEINGAFAQIMEVGYWWSSSVISTVESWSRAVANWQSGKVFHIHDIRQNGLPVRCIKDH